MNRVVQYLVSTRKTDDLHERISACMVSEESLEKNFEVWIVNRCVHDRDYVINVVQRVHKYYYDLGHHG